MKPHLLVAIVFMVGWAAADEPSPGHRLYERNAERPGTVVDMYLERDGSYIATVKAPGRPVVRVPKRESVPPPEMRWVSQDLLEIAYGSGMGADRTSVFYSARRNRFDGPYGLVRAVDPVNELVLCAVEDVTVRRLFLGRRSSFVVTVPDISRAALKWFVVSSESRFTDGTLHLVYMTNEHDDDEKGGRRKWVSKDVAIPRRLLKGKPDRE